MTGRLFPIMALSHRPADDIRALRNAGATAVIIALPWDVIAPHAAQAQRNHGQTVEHLAERGGLGSCEAVAVLEDRRWKRMAPGEANAALLRTLAELSS